MKENFTYAKFSHFHLSSESVNETFKGWQIFIELFASLNKFKLQTDNFHQKEKCWHFLRKLKKLFFCKKMHDYEIILSRGCWRQMSGAKKIFSLILIFPLEVQERGEIYFHIMSLWLAWRYIKNREFFSTSPAPSSHVRWVIFYTRNVNRNVNASWRISIWNMYKN